MPPVTPRRRTDDPSPDITAEAADALFAGLPQVIAELRAGRKENRRVARVARGVAFFALGSLLLLGYRSETQQDRLDEAARLDRASAFQACQDINSNAARLNRFLDQVIESVRASRVLNAAEKQQRVAQYEEIKQTLPACRKP